MLYYNLQPVFEARQIDKPYTFLVKAGIAPHTASKIIRNDMHVLRLSHVEIICKALYCEPNDLLAYKQDTNNPLPENHPLNNLIPKTDEVDWEQQFKTMPLAKLKQMSKLMNKDL